MKKFLVLYRSSVPAEQMMATVPAEQAKAGMEMWMNWSRKAGPAIVEMGAPLGHGRTLSGKSATSTSSDVTGYSVLQANSMDEVVKLLDGHPHFHSPGAQIEVLEALSMPGM